MNQQPKNISNMTREELEKNLKIFSVIQYLSVFPPLILIFLLEYVVPVFDHEMKIILYPLLAVMAVVDYLVIRFFLVEKFRKRLVEMNNSSGKERGAA